MKQTLGGRKRKGEKGSEEGIQYAEKCSRCHKAVWDPGL